MVTSQVVFAVGAVVVLSIGSVAWATERRYLGGWILGFGFVLATLWAVLGVMYPERAGMEAQTYLLFGTMAGSFAIYFMHTAFYTRPARRGRR